MSMHKSGRNDNVTPGSSCKGTPGFDRIPAVHMPANVPQSDTTLGDYIARKQQQVAFEDVSQEKKVTFEEWWDTNKRLIFTFQATNEYTAEVYDLMEMAWEMGQENK